MMAPNTNAAPTMTHDQPPINQAMLVPRIDHQQ